MTVAPGFIPPYFDEVVEKYGLTVLNGGADMSLVNGDIELTKDLDLKVGDTVYNALFRFVQAVRLNTPHLRFLFELVGTMSSRRKELDDKLNAAGEGAAERFDISKSLADDQLFMSQFREISAQQGAAAYGYGTYAGCVVLLLSGSLLRFKDDIEATTDDWNKAPPIFNGYSLGQIVVAAANGFRHDDEWAKTRPATRQQQTSQHVLARALPAVSATVERSPGRCTEVLDLLSDGDNFDRLLEKLYVFVHNVALGRRVT
ncbi:MAG TPA: hypothetical protein VG651_04560 [Stellaceae bacterium]|nr:hypothetical protein [Stellaceae bacterium]